MAHCAVCMYVFSVHVCATRSLLILHFTRYKLMAAGRRRSLNEFPIKIEFFVSRFLLFHERAVSECTRDALHFTLSSLTMMRTTTHGDKSKFSRPKCERNEKLNWRLGAVHRHKLETQSILIDFNLFH